MKTFLAFVDELPGVFCKRFYLTLGNLLAHYILVVDVLPLSDYIVELGIFRD